MTAIAWTDWDATRIASTFDRRSMLSSFSAFSMSLVQRDCGFFVAIFLGQTDMLFLAILPSSMLASKLVRCSGARCWDAASSAGSARAWTLESASAAARTL